jgi:hypothetical protein
MIRGSAKINSYFTAQEFWPSARRKRRAYPARGSVRSEQRSPRPKEPAGKCEVIFARPNSIDHRMSTPMRTCHSVMRGFICQVANIVLAAIVAFAYRITPPRHRNIMAVPILSQISILRYQNAKIVIRCSLSHSGTKCAD